MPQSTEDYSPGDRVEAFYEGVWRPGEICEGNPPQAGFEICVKLDEGGCYDFPEHKVKPAGD